jgi:twitching motility protein PilI
LSCAIQKRGSRVSNTEIKSAQIIAIDSRKARAAEGAHEAHKPSRDGYRMAGCGFLLGERVLSEVVVEPAIFPVPKAPEWLLGLVNVRGNIVPVFDLWKFVSTQMPQRDACTVLVLNLGEDAVGLVIDSCKTAVPLDGQMVRTPPPAPALQPFLGRGLYAFGGEWWEFEYQTFLAQLSAVDSR